MAVQTTLDHYYPPDSIEAESWLHVQRYTHTHHVTWKHVAYAARYHALSSFLQSLGNSYPFDNNNNNTSTSSTPSSFSSTLPPSPTTSNSSLESGSSSGVGVGTTTTLSASPTLVAPPTPSEILYLPPRTLGDLEDVFRRLAMAYMLTHISYLRAGLRGSDFSKMKEIAFGGLKELLGHSTTSTSTTRSRSTDSTTTTTPAHHHHRSGSAERVSGKGRELLRMVEGRQDWDGTVQADRYRRRGSVGSVGSNTSATSTSPSVSGSSGAISA
ncbi:hypothetical protein FRC17_010305 [Serendipita sp. 399]|nr:hypothetical protein FRC17_010305 [Serendipita sp. 399]